MMHVPTTLAALPGSKTDVGRDFSRFEINDLEMVAQTGIALAVGREASDA